MIPHKTRLYYLLQLSGWFVYVVTAAILNQLRGKNFDADLALTLISVYCIGLGTTHLYRTLILRWQWTRMKILQLVPRIVLGVLGFSVLFQLLFYLAVTAFVYHTFTWDWIETITNMLNWQLLFLIWSLVYFGVHFFERYSNEEIKNLKWEASRNEMELNKLKSQLNPHFIFNAMNTIRALVDEDPKKAKRSITQLSNILRNTLQMGRKKTVSFAEELKVVSDYIDLEKARFEERLHCRSEIDPDSYRFQVPALMMQTLIENGIKHGISHLPQGGELLLRTTVQNDLLHIEVENSGQLNGSFSSATGFGLANTRHRLQLLYGEKAKFEIQNKDGSTVLTHVIIPNETRI